MFAREWSDPLAGLARKLDEIAAKHRDSKIACLVVMITHDETIDGKLQKWGEEANIKYVLLSVMEPAGPPKFDLHKNADITVVMYRGRKIETNHAFPRGNITDKNVDAIVADAVKLASRK